jgi:hypothetical protein
MRTFPTIGLAIVALFMVGLVLPANAAADDAQEIRNREKQEDAAIAPGNFDAFISIYSPDKDLVVFDEDAPFEFVGINAWRDGWRNNWPGAKSKC